MQKYEYLIQSVIKSVPFHLRPDCYQAACLGLAIAIKNKGKAKSFNAYAYACMKSEVIRLLSELLYPVSLDKTTFLLLHKYRKSIESEGNINLPNVSKSREKNLKRLLSIRRGFSLQRNVSRGAL